MEVKCHCGLDAVYRRDRQHYHGKAAWYCSNYPECYSYVAAHYDGTPMGILAGPRTHGLRYKIHCYVDPLWQKGYITRTDTYQWLAELTDTPVGTFHIANLNCEQAEELLNKLEEQKDYNLEFIQTYGGTYSI